MRVTISGARYDTETAIELCAVEGGDGIDGYEEGLYYKPRSKKFFLAGKGGWATKYRKGMLPWAKILPLTKKQAKEWCIRFLDKELKDVLKIALEDTKKRNK